MTEVEYADLVRNAAAKWPLIVRALKHRHPNANHTLIEDCAESALVSFQDRKTILTIRHPERPLTWLIATADHFFCRECRKMTHLLHFDELADEPSAPDRGIECFEATQATKVIFSTMNERYSKILMDIDGEELSFEEIAEREGKPVKAIYDRYENAKKKARKMGIKIGVAPLQKPRQSLLKLIPRIHRIRLRNFWSEAALYYNEQIQRISHFIFH